MGGGFFKNLRHGTVAALFALATFGFQSLALPAHAAAHAADRVLATSAPDASTSAGELHAVEAGCDLCALASQIAADAPDAIASAAVDAIEAADLFRSTPVFVAPSAPTPPARAPPSMIASGL